MILGVIASNVLSTPNALTFITTSEATTFTFSTVTKTGATMHWKAEGPAITTQEIDANNPTFNFSANAATNQDITITCTSSDGFGGLTQLDLGVTDDPIDGYGSQIHTANINLATALNYLSFRYCKVEQCDLSNQTALTEFVGRGRGQWSNGLDLSASISTLQAIHLDVVDGNACFPSLAGCSALTDFRYYEINNNTDSIYLAQCLIHINNDGPSSGSVQYLPDTGFPGIHPYGYNAYQNLTGVKTWTIDASAPNPNLDYGDHAASDPEVNSLGTHITTNISSVDATQYYVTPLYASARSIKLTSVSGVWEHDKVYFPVTNTLNYEVKIALRQSGASVPQSIYVRNVSDTAYWVVATSITHGTSWQIYTLNFTATETGDAHLRLYASINDAGNSAGDALWFDFLYIYQV